MLFGLTEEKKTLYTSAVKPSDMEKIKHDRACCYKGITYEVWCFSNRTSKSVLFLLYHCLMHYYRNFNF